MFDRLKARLVADWRTAHKWWSVRIAVILGIIGTYGLYLLANAPEVLVQVLNMLPPELRGWLPPFAGPVITGVIVVIRLWKQGGKPNA